MQVNCNMSAAPECQTLPQFHLNRLSDPQASHHRAFLRDLADLFLQQMFFWGCDSQNRLLTGSGAERIARTMVGSEGSSRYRWRWKNGIVELHSFCAGWFPVEAPSVGVVFIRGRERFYTCSAGEPLEPGRYRAERFVACSSENLLEQLKPLLEWILEYETRILLRTPCGYRTRCHLLYEKQPRSQVWLAPEAATEWLGQLLSGEVLPTRARHLLRRRPKGGVDSLVGGGAQVNRS